jgi:hypothetical protein
MHSPQSMHVAGSMRIRLSRTLMAFVGQAFEQSTHPTQRPSSRMTE